MTVDEWLRAMGLHQADTIGRLPAQAVPDQLLGRVSESRSRAAPLVGPLPQQRAGGGEPATAPSSSQSIARAVDVIMARELLPEAAAFDRLRALSNQARRRLTDIAVEVVETGALPAVRPGPRTGGGLTGRWPR
jgi:hypothetical protein